MNEKPLLCGIHANVYITLHYITRQLSVKDYLFFITLKDASFNFIVSVKIGKALLS